LLLDSLKRNEPTPQLDGVYALLVHPDESLEYYEGRRWSRVRGSPFAAIGNGSSFALAAMTHGATAVEAVRVAMKLDTHSGGRVHSVTLKKKRKARGKSAR